MSVLPVRLYGDPILREKAEPVGEVTDEMRALAANMAETMYANDGIGIAGNQVGIAKRIVIIDTSEEYAGSKRNGRRTRPKNPEFEVILDPEIIAASDEDCEYNEGCLSIPEVEAKVYRPVTVTVRWRDLDGKIHEEQMDELRARVMQHEVDHLDGVLFIDRLATAARTRLAGKLNTLRLQTEASLKK